MVYYLPILPQRHLQEAVIQEEKQAASRLSFSTILFFSFCHSFKKSSSSSRKKSISTFNYFTLTVTLTDLDPDFTVIFTVPFFFPVTTPLEETVAIFLLELV